ncbi:MAG: response regulator [Geminicoccaceae bacterium]
MTPPDGKTLGTGRRGAAEGRDGPANELAALRAQVAAAEARSAARAAFLAMVSHEIREPMNGVLGMARLLRDTVLDAEQQAHVGTIVDSAETLLTIINDVLDLSRVDAGRLEIAALPFALEPFLARLEALLRPRAAARGLGLAVSLDPALPRAVLGDPGRLRQVLLNLLGNALKFTERGGIALTCRKGAGERLVIEVQDSGPGIAADALARLFGAWGQADAAVTRLFGGSGLGLMLAQRLCEGMGGRLAVAPGEGGGCRFTVDLPLQPAPETAATAEAEVSLAGAALLVVDADARTRLRLRALAAGWGMVARDADSATAALALLREAADRGAAFDIVLVDRGLPDGGAGALATRIRAEPALAHAVLVQLAGPGLRGDAARAAAAGFAAYLRKPVAAATLLDCLRTLRRPDRGAGGLITEHSLSDGRAAPLRLLLVDDNPVNLRLAGILLERAGHAVATAGDGVAAVEAVARDRFDLVLMDVQMPVLDGLEAARRIRALPDAARARVPIVAVTANAMQGDAATCRAAGMDGFVAKPFDRATLLSTVERLARRAA